MKFRSAWRPKGGVFPFIHKCSKLVHCSVELPQRFLKAWLKNGWKINVSFSHYFLQPHKFTHTHFVTLHKENNDCKRALAKNKQKPHKSRRRDKHLRCSFQERVFFFFFLFKTSEKRFRINQPKDWYRVMYTSMQKYSKTSAISCKTSERHVLERLEFCPEPKGPSSAFI